MALIELATVRVQRDEDVDSARQGASRIAALLGFAPQDQAHVATAVSEIARNAHRYAGAGSVAYLLDRDASPHSLVVRITDSGPGIPHLDAVLAGQYVSTTGPGAGILAAKRLMDTLFIDTTRGRGTSVLMRKALPPSAAVITPERQAAISELQARHHELVRLNRELEETNRGGAALDAELDDRAGALRSAAKLKSRFHSNMTHEFRTPVVSILGLCDLLIQRRAREGVPPEAEVIYIRDSAEQLAALVDDLLDLAKMDAGRWQVRESELSIPDLFGTLRGMLKPLLRGPDVALVFEEPPELPALVTDAARVSQILRNLVSNALKFTDAGEIRISARRADEDHVEILVSDTGVGISADNHERIFEEFFQLADRVSPRPRGTGLGLPLSRRLAEILGGRLTVASQAGMGSTFTLRLPLTPSRA